MVNKSPARKQDERRFDVVLYGATGFVGRQTVAYFAQHAEVKAAGLRWAIAGRSKKKLETVRAECAAHDAGLLVADAHDASALDVLARSARVVLSTAGPFALYGTPLVEACVRSGTHYVDITGETPWVQGLIERLHAKAAHGVKGQGTRIIPFCGFDSVPSDLAVRLANEAVLARFGEPCVAVKSAFGLRGGFNGGTLASMFNMYASGQAKAVADPFLLNPPAQRPASTQGHLDPKGPVYDCDFAAWLGPFVMAPVNTRVVRRSAALLAYPADFRYQEYLRLGRGTAAAVAASAVSAGSLIGQAAMQFKVVRKLSEMLAPAPGSGPSEAAMDGGSFRCHWVATSLSGQRLRGLIVDRGDPGNRATTKMVCESALALALQPHELPGGRGYGGVLTPASGLGDVLVQRLRKAGMTLRVGG